ncbi:MAG: hypothetical protein ACQERU_09510 [Bacteroidota bacterium]
MNNKKLIFLVVFVLLLYLKLFAYQNKYSCDENICHKLNNTKVKSLNGNIILLSDLIKEKHLILYFSNRSCRSCVINSLHVIKKLEQNGVERIIVISFYDKLRQLMIDLNNSKVSSDSYNAMQPLDLPGESKQKAQKGVYLMIVDDKLNIIKYLEAGEPEMPINSSYIQNITKLLND